VNEERQLLGLDGLPRGVLEGLLESAEGFRGLLERTHKKLNLLRGRSVALVFMEASTRTLTSFDMAGKRLGADTHSLRGSSSSLKKGESLRDTVRNIDAMRPDVIVLRHACSGAAHLAAASTRASVVNAGDGSHEHPTQGLLDLLTLREQWGPDLSGRVVTIIGDIAHSRVARSDLFGLKTLGASVRFCAPPTLMPSGVRELGAEPFERLGPALEGADAAIVLRIQLERAAGPGLPSLREYAMTYGISQRVLERHASDDMLILHPGPVNRGVELAPEVADGERSVILDQVTNGVAARMAVLCRACGERAPTADEIGAQS
jgi:aspartate carbamoyltransferase catalytic subunit